jgi:hypothetical protein
MSKPPAILNLYSYIVERVTLQERFTRREENLRGLQSNQHKCIFNSSI